MIKVSFTEEIIRKLDYERYHYPHPQRLVTIEAN